MGGAAEDSTPGAGETAWAEVLHRGYEGMVAKDPEVPYVGGRSLKWLKVKVQKYREEERGFYKPLATGLNARGVVGSRNPPVRLAGLGHKSLRFLTVPPSPAQYCQRWTLRILRTTTPHSAADGSAPEQRRNSSRPS
jgi:hypothetical protein